ncbi:ABC transporter substrate-binding protein [Paenibacillus sp. 1P07SE]|uniref:ABC transporter substrate-binding protein n=1 Tax=Paenibacillus sp. 1P07SE TaxID=3132209 RepID=UPI0039A4E420
MKMKITGHLVLLLIIAIALSACAANEVTTPGSSPDAGAGSVAPAVDEGGEKVLRIRFYDDPAGFDPATVFRVENEAIAFNVFSGLTTYDSETGEILPDLAESWETSDNVTWTFNLREGVQWQKGYGEFTSADVVYTYERIMAPDTASPYATDLANVKSLTAPDEYTVVYELHQADANFLHVVANYHQGQIVKQEAVEEHGEQFRWNPVGTGPYELESISTNSEIVLTRHEDYYKGPAPIAKLQFIIIKDEETATIALQNGEVDIAMRINRDEALARLERDGFSMNARMDRSISVKVFNTSEPPFDDVRVRQAWAHAVDYASIYETLQPYLAQGTTNILPSWMDGYSEEVPVYAYDPERAKELLAEAGYPDGFTVTQPLVASNGVREAEQLEQEYLQAVGIQLEFELVDAPVFNQRRNSGEFQLSSRALPAINPDTILFSYLHPDNIAPRGLNGARYDNPELTKKLEAARAEVDAEARAELYKEVQQIALADLAYLPTQSLHGYWPSQPYVVGVHLNPLSKVNFYEVDIQN